LNVITDWNVHPNKEGSVGGKKRDIYQKEQSDIYQVHRGSKTVHEEQITTIVNDNSDCTSLQNEGTGIKNYCHFYSLLYFFFC
jgi:hypothetical protein